MKILNSSRTIILLCVVALAVHCSSSTTETRRVTLDIPSTPIYYLLLPSTSIYYPLQLSTRCVRCRSLRLDDGETKYTKSLQTTDRYNYILQYRSPYVHLVHVYVRTSRGASSVEKFLVEGDGPVGEMVGNSGDRVLTSKSAVHII